MKSFSLFRRLGILAVTVMLSVSLYAFDWEAKPNDVLFNNMLRYASMMADSTSGTALQPVLKKFLKKQKKQFKKHPYAWMEDTYACVCDLQALLPPVYDDGSREARLRRMILRLCDFPIHQHDKYDKRPKHPAGHWTPPEEQTKAYQDFRWAYMDDACNKAVAWLHRKAPKAGELAVFKAYNMGVLVRTDKHCIAFDMAYRLTDEFINEVVEYADILFMSHRDGDHRNAKLMEKMLTAGKTVFLAYDVMPDQASPNKRVVWENVLDRPIEIAGIQIRLVAGFQGKRGTPGGTPNNIYHITLDGWSVTHNGDNNDLEAYRYLSGLPLPDLAVTNCWNKLQYYMSALKQCKEYGKKKITFISAHENETGHNVQQRESWWETFTRKDRYGNPDYAYPPVMFLNQGESIVLTR